MIGKCCWAVIAGGMGSMATIHLGAYVRREMRLQASAIGQTKASFRGEYCIFVQGCAWRLNDKDSVVCGWRDSGVTIEAELARLEGSIVSELRLDTQMFDLTARFENGLTLRLFCDQTGSVDSTPNYSIKTPQNLFSVRPRSVLAVEGVNQD
jgi:hypothetical protein